MTIHIPSALRSYTKQKGEVEAEGRTLADMLSALDQLGRSQTQEDVVYNNLAEWAHGERGLGKSSTLT